MDIPTTGARSPLARWLHRLSLLACLCLCGTVWVPTLLHPGALLYRDMFVTAHPPLRASLFSGAATDLRTLPQDAILGIIGTVFNASWFVRLLLIATWLVGCRASCRLVARWVGSVRTAASPTHSPASAAAAPMSASPTHSPASAVAAPTGWRSAPGWRLTLGQCAAIVLVSSNPYVVERLLQGHWSVVMAGFLLPAVVLGVVSRSWWVLAPLVVASFTPTGWILAVVTAAAWWVCADVAGPSAPRPSTTDSRQSGRRSEAGVTSSRPRGRRSEAGVAGSRPRGRRSEAGVNGSRPYNRWLGAGVVGTAVVMCLPWVIPALGSEGVTLSSVDSAAAFAANSDHLDSPGALVFALLSMGGIWNKQAVPSGLNPLVTVFCAVVSLVLLAALARWAARSKRRLFVPWAVGVAAVVLPVLAASGPGLTVMGWIITHVPGGGLLRDTQKFVILLLPVLVLGVATVARSRRTAAGAAIPVTAAVALSGDSARCGAAVPSSTLVRSGEGVRSNAAARFGAAIPLGAVVALGLAVGLGSAPSMAVLQPAAVPSAWQEMANYLAEHGQPEDELLPLPLASYRTLQVGDAASPEGVRSVPIVDPAGKLFDVRVLDPGALVVDGQVVGIDNPHAWRMASLAMVDRAEASELSAAGVRWIVLDASVESAADVHQLPAVTGSTLVASSGELELYRTP